MRLHRWVSLFICLVLCCFFCTGALAEGFGTEEKSETDAERLLRGYNKEDGYVYVTFGSYPFTKDGEVRPCVWRVLSIENDYAFLLNEYVVDFKRFHTEKVDQEAWKDYELYTVMNTEMVATMFTDDEKAIVRHTDDLGWLFILSNKEFMTKDYGFRPILTEVEWERECAPTPWALAQPDSYIHENGNTWYWSRTCRHVAAGGYEHILGYNGHISMAGFLRIGGVRPACFVDCGRLDSVTGSGTREDPYTFEIVE